MPLMMNFLRIEHVKLTFGGVVEPDMIFAHIFGISCFKYHLTRLYNIRVHRNTNGKFYFTQHHIPRDFSQIRITGNHGQGTTHVFGNNSQVPKILRSSAGKDTLECKKLVRENIVLIYSQHSLAKTFPQQKFAQTVDCKAKY